MVFLLEVCHSVSAKWYHVVPCGTHLQGAVLMCIVCIAQVHKVVTIEHEKISFADANAS